MNQHAVSPPKISLRDRFFLAGILFSFFVVTVQTIRSKNAFFYSDDFTFISQSNESFNETFTLANGHFAPVVRITYKLMFEIFGITSYLPYLVLSGLLNWILCLSLGWFIRQRKLNNTLLLIAPSIVIVVPFSGHTIFWLAAAINLLSPSLLMVYLTINSLRLRILAASLFSIIGIGIGGYGLILVLGILYSNILKKSKTLITISLIMLLFTAGAYSQNNSTPNQIVDKRMVTWLTENFFNSIRLFTPLIPESSVLNIFFELMFYVSFVLITPVVVRKISSKAKILALDISVLVLTYFSFLLLIWLARNGVEPISASRYVVIAFTLVSVIIILGGSLIEEVFRYKNRILSMNTIVLIVLLITSLTRFGYWWQAPSDIGYQSSLNRLTVNQIVCGRESSREFLDKAVLQDGLIYLSNSLQSELWQGYRMSKCGVEINPKK
jgi:hypothetical protein